MLRETLGILLISALIALWAELRARRADRHWNSLRTRNSDAFYANTQRRHRGFWA